MLRPFFESHPDSWVLIPTLSITAGRCENPACEKVHAFVLVASFVGFSAGLEFSF